MKQPPVIALVGDRDDRVTAHVAIHRALEFARAASGADLQWRWLGTEGVAATSLAEFAGIWLVPASPYRSLDGALAAVSFARKRGIPFLGTCGGFQHAVIEFARDVAGLAEADHAETNPDSSTAVIAPLACSLVEVSGRVRFAPGSRLLSAYGTPDAVEGYHCRFGLNENYRSALEAAGFHFTAFDDQGAVRGGELPGHPFFVGTLFQPERRASQDEAVPLVNAFVKAVVLNTRPVGSAI